LPQENTTLTFVKEAISIIASGKHYTSMPTGFFIWGYMYPFTFIFGGTSKFLGVFFVNITGFNSNSTSDWTIKK
jgi:hypothetical protein